MNKTVIKCGLSVDEIDKAIKEIEKFKEDFRKKVDTYRKRIAEEVRASAQLNFGNSIVDDVIGTIVDGKVVKGVTSRKADVTVDVDERGSILVVVAHGEDAVWCEFGSGVYHNGSVGSSPHPRGDKLGFKIGSYGKGHGKQEVWGYKDEKGEIVITHGTPATMPMYNAAMEVKRKAVAIAREVFG